MSLRGYSLILVKANRDADSRHIGVRLGKWCIRMNIPVSEVAQQFGVSRMTVYSWFTGTSRPRKDKVDQIEKLLKA
jgi:hypothetical protein